MENIVLRPYQEECVDLIDRTETGSHLIAMATALGKTAVFSHIKRNGRVLILSHRDELVRQPEKFYDCPFGIEKAEETSHGEEVVSASVQTLSRDTRLQKFAPDEFDTVIVDEAHHAAAPSYKKVLRYFSGARLVLGFTATPKRGDNVRLDDVFDDILYQKDLRWGIENGYLSRLRCKIVRADFSLSGVGKVAGDYNLHDLENAVGDEATYALTAKVYRDSCHKKGRHTLIYCVSIQACRNMVEAIRALVPGEADTIQMVTGATDPEERGRLLAGFASGEIRCLVNCMVLTEGTDLPVCDTIINLRPTCNASLYTQIVGRGTRLCEGKDYCLVIDVIPEDGNARCLCTAPTLFGIDPLFLDREDAEKLDEDADLIGVCDILKGNIVNLAEKLAYRLEEVDRMVSDMERPIMDASDFRSLLAGDACPWRGGDETGDEDLDFAGLFVRRNADDEKAFMVRPNYYERIYMSKPDVLGNTVLRFEVQAPLHSGLSGDCFIGELPWDEAIKLVRGYCSMQQDYFRYCWDTESVSEWEERPCTLKQEGRLKKDYKKYGLSVQDAKDVNKLDASLLIDYASEITRLKEFLKEYSCPQNAKRSTKEKKLDAFTEAEKMEKERETAGKEQFGKFVEAIQKHIRYIERKAREEQERRAHLKDIPSYQTPVTLFGGPLFGPTENQASYLRSLVKKTASMGYRLPDGFGMDGLSMRQAGCLISILKAMTDNLPVLDAHKYMVNIADILKHANEDDMDQFTPEVMFSKEKAALTEGTAIEQSTKN